MTDKPVSQSSPVKPTVQTHLNAFETTNNRQAPPFSQILLLQLFGFSVIILSIGGIVVVVVIPLLVVVVLVVVVLVVVVLVVVVLVVVVLVVDVLVVKVLVVEVLVVLVVVVLVVVVSVFLNLINFQKNSVIIENLLEISQNFPSKSAFN